MQLHDTGFDASFFKDLMGGDDMCSATTKEVDLFQELSHLKDRNTNAPVPCRRIPCKARSLSSTHDVDNAFFDVPVNAPHGLLLCCSHPECAASGRRFRYCQVCALPAAKRNFLKRHGHGLIDSSKELREDVDEVCGVILSTLSGPTQVVSSPSAHPKSRPQHRRAHSYNHAKSNANPFNLTTSNPVNEGSPARNRSLSNGEEMSFGHQQAVPPPRKQHRRLMSFDGINSSKGHEDHNEDSYSDLSNGEKQWLSLLSQRPELDDQSGMCNWMDKVLLFSEGKRLNENPNPQASPTNVTSAPPPMIDPLQLLAPPVSAPIAMNNETMRHSPSLPSLPEHERVVAPKPLTVGDCLAVDGSHPEMTLNSTFNVHPISPEDHPSVVSMSEMDIDHEPWKLADLPFDPNDVYGSEQTTDSSSTDHSSKRSHDSMTEMDSPEAEHTSPYHNEVVITDDEFASVFGNSSSFVMLAD